MKKTLLVIGVGNTFRNDDAAGILVARAVKERNIPGVEVIEESGEGTSLMEAWKGADIVYLIDAVSSGSAPDTIHRIDAQAQNVPTDFFHYSTHAFSVAEAVELGRALHHLPAVLVIYGIEGKNFTAGTKLTPGVLGSIKKVKDLILEEIKKEADPAL